MGEQDTHTDRFVNLAMRERCSEARYTVRLRRIASAAPPATSAPPNSTMGAAGPPVNGSVCELPTRTVVVVVTCAFVVSGAVATVDVEPSGPSVVDVCGASVVDVSGASVVDVDVLVGAIVVDVVVGSTVVVVVVGSTVVVVVVGSTVVVVVGSTVVVVGSTVVDVDVDVDVDVLVDVVAVSIFGENVNDNVVVCVPGPLGRPSVVLIVPSRPPQPAAPAGIAGAE